MRFLVALLGSIVPLPALALSCLAPTVERSFATFQASDDIYIIVHGRLTLDTELLPKGMTLDSDPPEMTLVPAQLVGKSLGAEGFRFPFEDSITLEVSCIGPWCGGIENGADVLTFLRETEDGYALAISPCGGSAFTEPKGAQLRQVAQCFKARGCD